MPHDLDWRAAYDAGIAALDSDAFSDARTLFKAALDGGATSWEPHYAWAWTVLRDPVTATDADLLVELEKDLDAALTRFGSVSDLSALRGQVAARRGDHERAVEYLLISVARSSQRDAVVTCLAESLGSVLAEAERGQTSAGGESPIDLCDRLERLIGVTALPLPIQDELVGEVVATRAFCRQQGGDEEGALEDLRRVRRLVADHPRVSASIADLGGAPKTSTTVGSTGEPRFSSLGGAGNPKSFMYELRRLFEVYLGNPDPHATRVSLAEYGQTPMRSILLFGPSGCGKTFVVRAFSGEYWHRHHRELPIFRLKMDEVFGHYSGDGERKLTEVFDKAIDTQPSIVFCDEVDAVGGTRERGEAWRTALTGHFLQQLDRAREMGAALIFFGCTNRVWSVDLALLRRFDRLLPVELPDDKARREILRIYIERIGPQLRAHDIDLELLSRMAHGLTPGDLQKLVARATDDIVPAPQATGAGLLTQERLMDALSHYKNPIHVREWVRLSFNALRNIGQDEMADELERMYVPYVGRIGLDGAAGGHTRVTLPEQAWAESVDQNLTELRRYRGR